jgi:hypothetical protein
MTTVKQLIERLSELDQDLPVYIQLTADGKTNTAEPKYVLTDNSLFDTPAVWLANEPTQQRPVSE